MRACLRMSNGDKYSVGEEKPSIECFRCGICCIGYNPLLTVEEVGLMAEGLSMGTDEFLDRYVDITLVGYLLRQTENGCVFLSWEKGTSKSSCRVYSIRPEVCRSWVPGLSRRECREGLARLQIDNRILLVDEIYENQEEIERFCASLRQPEKA